MTSAFHFQACNLSQGVSHPAVTGAWHYKDEGVKLIKGIVYLQN